MPDEGQRVHVYYRLTKGDLSVRNTDRIVVANLECAILRQAEFRVQPAGRQRTLDEECRNVHAFVYGYWATDCPVECPVPVRYNPYEAGHFQTLDDTPVHESDWVIIEGNRCYIPEAP